MKKLKLLFAFIFAFVSLSSFTNGKVVVDTQQDSTQQVVQIQFENPRILIDDYRDLKGRIEIAERNAETVSEVAGNFNDLAEGVLEHLISQERRYESAMDYLTRTTGYPVDEIYEAYDRKRKTDIILIATALLLIVFISYNTFDQRKGGWQAQVALFLVLGMASSISIWLVDRLLLFTVNQDYHLINQLLTLSG